MLLQRVPLKLDQLLAWETALIAGVGAFSSVCALVYLQMIRLSARIVALVTLERFHSWMRPNVFHKKNQSNSSPRAWSCYEGKAGRFFFLPKVPLCASSTRAAEAGWIACLKNCIDCSCERSGGARHDQGSPRWNQRQTFIRNHFCWPSIPGKVE